VRGGQTTKSAPTAPGWLMPRWDNRMRMYDRDERPRGVDLVESMRTVGESVCRPFASDRHYQSPLSGSILPPFLDTRRAA
jgi:hypothetical protein